MDMHQCCPSERLATPVSLLDVCRVLNVMLLPSGAHLVHLAVIRWRSGISTGIIVPKRILPSVVRTLFFVLHRAGSRQTAVFNSVIQGMAFTPAPRHTGV